MAQFDDKQKQRIVHLIESLLIEPKIRENVVSDFAKHKQGYNNVLIVIESSKIYFGKYNWNDFFGNFFNKLIKCYEEISFSDFFIKTWDALVDMTVGTAAHKAVLEGLSRETLLEGIHNRKYDWIVDRFFDVCRHLTNDGYWKTIGTKTDLDDEPSHHVKGCPFSDGVEIHVNKQPQSPPMTWRVVDSVGEPFEILNVRWVGGGRN